MPAFMEVDADDSHPFDQGLGQDLVGGPSSLQQDVDALHHLVGQAVVEILVHLKDEFLVVQRGKIEFLTFIRHVRPFPEYHEPRE